MGGCACRQKLVDALLAGTTLVVDRYAYSGAAYTAAQMDSQHAAQALDLDWCKVGLPHASLPGCRRGLAVVGSHCLPA